METLMAIGGLVNLIIGITAIAASDSVDANVKDELVAVGAVLAVLGAILLLVAICLIIGAAKGNPALLVPWMVYTILFLIANTVLYIFDAAQYSAKGYTFIGGGYITGAVISVLLQTYFLLVVYSLYRELKGTAPQNSA